MCIIDYDANDKMCWWKRKNKGQLERALENVNKFFFSCAKSQSAFVVNIAPNVNHHSARKQNSLMEIISVDIEERKDHQQGPVVRRPRNLRPPLSV